MKDLLFWVAFIMGAIVTLAIGFMVLQVFECGNGFLVWGNTFRFGFTTYELQCYFSTT
jgi:hypothetical protein